MLASTAGSRIDQIVGCMGIYQQQSHHCRGHTSHKAVRVARRFFHLPYFDAKFQIAYRGEDVEYSAVRTHPGAPKANFAANYRPTGPVYHSAPGSLDSWLTERYCLYAADGAGHLYRGEIDHDRWPLQPAADEVQINTLGDWLGIEMKGPPATLHFAKSLEVRAWLVERV
jgi:uncharacterized protein YqjF (DUF2071 family)